MRHFGYMPVGGYDYVQYLPVAEINLFPSPRIKSRKGLCSYTFRDEKETIQFSRLRKIFG